MRRSCRVKSKYNDAQLLGFALAAARMMWGLAQFVAPVAIDRRVRQWDRAAMEAEKPAASQVGWRMKGIRDVAMGLGALTTPSSTLGLWFRAGALVDMGDTFATIGDRRRTLRGYMTLFGTMAGIASVLIGIAAAESSEGRR